MVIAPTLWRLAVCTISTNAASGLQPRHATSPPFGGVEDPRAVPAESVDRAAKSIHIHLF
ncbi:hypothetical protein [Mycolicibacterium peregrinum]|uniref:hypothetical protein n=1 Tax=Mycolicibacterium peregrinum TaxID=43304 RepID=UPI0009ED34D3|nr:hypothetical protein [Mycolicibacterium peregrinum]